MFIRNLVFLTIFLAATLSTHAQKYEYIKIYTTQAGVEDRDKAKFVFPDNPDSAKLYNAFKLPDILLGIEMMERKGFVLYTITSNTHSIGLGALIITTAIMRREKVSKANP